MNHFKKYYKSIKPLFSFRTASKIKHSEIYSDFQEYINIKLFVM